MTDTHEGSTNRSDATKSSLAVGESEVKDAIPSKPATEADLEQVKKQMSGFERSTIRWTRASFVVILATGVFIGLQWHEMHTGGKDTSALAQAAQDQAAALKLQVEEMKKQGNDTHDLALAAKTQAERLQDLVHENQRTLATTKHNFIADERPYVWLSTMLASDVKPNERIRVDVWYANFGKTPAIRQKGNTSMIVAQGKDITPMIDEYFRVMHRKGIVGGSEIMLPPGIPADPTQSKAWHSILSDQIIGDQKTADTIKGTTGSFAVVGMIVYEDSSGNHYATDFCLMNLAGGALSYCPAHNEIH